MSANTPAHARGVPVPGIDTRGAFGSHDSSPRGISNSWSMTLPQTALDVRRPSLAYSSVSDASTSGPSSSCDYSQPATPVHSLGLASDQFSQSWNADSTLTSSIPEHCSLEQVSQAMYHSTIVQAMSNVDMSSYSPTRHHHSTQTFGTHDLSPMRNTWTPAYSAALSMNPGIMTNLFQTTQSLGQGINHTSSMYANPASSMHHPALEASAFQEHNHVPMYPPTQVVIPSQVNSQEDYSMEQYQDYDVNGSYSSSATEFSSEWAPVGPHSPDAAYFDQSEDEEHVNIKPEVSQTLGSRQTSAGNSPYRINRRTSRKSRKMTQSSQLREERDFHGITVRLEGKEWELDSEGHPIPKCPDDSKQHTCPFVEDGESCHGKFFRAEHLKRHMSKHYPPRYPCPLEGCTRKMSRSDNAGDHFKTHLSPPRKGKRNKLYTFEQLSDAMKGDERWEDESMIKMLSKLEKWSRDLKRHPADIKHAKVMDHDVMSRAESMQTSRSMSYNL